MKPVAYMRVRPFDGTVIGCYDKPSEYGKPVVYLEDAEKEIAGLKALYEGLCSQHSNLFEEKRKLLARYLEAVARAESCIGKEPVVLSSQITELSREGFIQQLLLKLAETGSFYGACNVVEEALNLVYPKTEPAKEECKHVATKQEITSKSIKVTCLKCGELVGCVGAFEQ